jgi:hypothetical protein
LKVFEFDFDAYNYQQVNVEGGLSVEIRTAARQGGSLKSIRNLEGIAYIIDPRLKAGDFYGMTGPPILTERAARGKRKKRKKGTDLFSD